MSFHFVSKRFHSDIIKKGALMFPFFLAGQRLSHEQNKRLTAFERSGMENFLMKQSVVDREHIDAKVSTASDR